MVRRGRDHKGGKGSVERWERGEEVDGCYGVL